MEHIPDDALAVQELSRVLLPGAALVGTVPAGPEQWSDWDVWADHQRRYDRAGLVRLLETAGFRPHVKIWGWPVLRVYDDLFLKKVNRRRLKHEGAISQDSSLAAVHTLGKRRVLVALVRCAFSFDRLFDGVRWGVGLLFVARKPPKLTP